MKFRTEITPTPLHSPIRLGEQLLALGSCFSEHIAHKLAEAKFPIATNPTGVLFNPASIAQSLDRWSRGEEFRPEEFIHGNGLWFHYELHGSLAREALSEAYDAAASAFRLAEATLRKADRLLVTFGTAWIYELRETGQIVANCHRQPHNLFRRRRLTVEQIVELWTPLLEGPLREKSVVMTLSPIRHLADGAAENSLSKATLRVAIDELQRRFPQQIEYFVAYELLTDDLRDYRFYSDDLTHPSAQAVNYIWEQFASTALDPAARAALPYLEALRRALEHRPLHPASESYKEFCIKNLHTIAELEKQFSIDLGEEKAHFQTQIG